MNKIILSLLSLAILSTYMFITPAKTEASGWHYGVYPGLTSTRNGDTITVVAPNWTNLGYEFGGETGYGTGSDPYFISFNPDPQWFQQVGGSCTPNINYANNTVTATFRYSNCGDNVVGVTMTKNGFDPYFAMTQEDYNIKVLNIPTNYPPSINPIPDTTLNQGSNFNLIGSFSDLDSVNWSATVDYGDGSGIQNLSLSGTDILFNHEYNQSGNFTTTVWITDDQNATGFITFSVTVNPVPINIEECKNDNWNNFPTLKFKNQGQCVKYVNHI